MAKRSKTLTKLELTELELASSRGSNRLMRIKLLENQKALRNAHVKQLEAQAQITQLNIQLTRNEISQIDTQISNENAKHKSVEAEDKVFKDRIKKKYGLKDNWGFDPETGELIDDE